MLHRREGLPVSKKTMPQDRTLIPAPVSSSLQPWWAVSHESDDGPQYTFNWPAATRAACLAALAITLYMMFIPRWLGIEEMDIGITIGGMTDPSGGLDAFLARLFWHVSNGFIYVFAYAAILLRRRRQSAAWKGIPFGVFLWLAGPMLLVPMVLNLQPLIQSGELTHPGVFMLSLGLGLKPAVVDLGAHLLHGITAAVIYKHRCA